MRCSHEAPTSTIDDLQWFLNFAVRAAVGWAQNIERGGEERDDCPHCGRSGPVPYSAKQEKRAWAMVANHVEKAIEAAWNLLANQGATP